MEFEQQLRVAFAPCEARPELRARILARTRPGNRTILFGTILVVAAAAAMLSWYLVRTTPPQPAAATLAATPAAESAAMTAAEPLPAEPAPPAPEATSTAVPQAVLPPVRPFIVQLLPLQNAATDAATTAAIDAFYTAFVTELQTVPGLVLTVVGTDEPVGEALPDFQLTIRGGGHTASGKYGLTVLGDEKRFVEMKRKLPAKSEEASNGYNFVTSMSGDITPSCAPVAGEDNLACRTPAAMAASLVESLRKRYFPEDPTLKLRLQSQLLDAALEPRQRLQALTDLGMRSARRDALQDPMVVRGALALAASASDPAVRAQVWRAMRGGRNPDLVAPVTAALLHESDAEVRLQAVVLLQEEFASDPRAREALEVVARGEARPLVRALATRALAGEKAWRDYIVASLKDTSRSDAERIEAFMYHVATPGPTPGSYNYSGQLGRTPDSSELLDEGAIQALTRLLPVAAKAPEFKPVMGSVFSLLASLQKPAITAMFRGMLEQSADAQLRELAANALRGSAGGQ